MTNVPRKTDTVTKTGQKIYQTLQYIMTHCHRNHCHNVNMCIYIQQNLIDFQQKKLLIRELTTLNITDNTTNTMGDIQIKHLSKKIKCTSLRKMSNFPRYVDNGAHN